MSYAGTFLKAAGHPCTVLRDPPVESFVSKRKASRSIQKGEFFWEGLILADSNLKSGDIFQVGNTKYLTHYVNNNSGELSWFAVKVNVDFTAKRLTSIVDEEGNVREEWQVVAEGVGFGEVVTAALRQADPGLLSSTKLILQIPKSHQIKKMDRVVINEDYQVDSVDNILVKGIARLQLAEDLRP